VARLSFVNLLIVFVLTSYLSRGANVCYTSVIAPHREHICLLPMDKTAVGSIYFIRNKYMLVIQRRRIVELDKAGTNEPKGEKRVEG